MSGHSNIGPSSAERWIACPASVKLAAACPPLKTTVYAAEGTVAHELAEQLVSDKIDELQLMAMKGLITEEAGHKIEITDEMIDGALFYRDTIAADRATLNGLNVHAFAEKRVLASSIDEELWGTADYLLFQKGRKLFVYDYKFGAGKIVEVVKNPQATCYAIGAIDSLAGEVFDEIELVIIQPRAPHIDGKVRRWKMPKEWINEFRSIACVALLESQGPNPRIAAGDYCRWCAAKAICPELYKEAQNQTKAVFENEPVPASNINLPAVGIMSIEQLAKALDWQDSIEDWFKAIKEQVRDALLSGVQVPGYKLGNSRSYRVWADEKKVIEHFGDKAFAPRELRSVAAMEKLVGKKDLPAELVIKPEGAKTVVKITDPRGASLETTAKEAFSGQPLLEAPAAKEKVWP